MVHLYQLPQRKGKQYCNISALIKLPHEWNRIRENRWILLPLYTGIKHVAIQTSPAPIKLKWHWWQEKKCTSWCHARQLERQKFQQRFLIEFHAGKKEEGNSYENWLTWPGVLQSKEVHWICQSPNNNWNYLLYLPQISNRIGSWFIKAYCWQFHCNISNVRTSVPQSNSKPISR